MTRLEQIEFENWDKFLLALEKARDKEEAFRTFKNKEEENIKKKIISNNNLYVGNNFSIKINQVDNGRVYLSINYFSVDDRFEMSKTKKGFKNANEI